MSVFALSLNHASASVDLRGRFALPPGQIAPALCALRERLAGRGEAAIVSTCNRTELYVGGADDAVAPALDWLAGVGGVPANALHPHVVVHDRPEAAARHAFRVASGLESMVLGEPQILGQVKAAVREAGAAGTLGATLHQMFQRSFAVAKEVRCHTEIGAQSVSLAAATVRLAGELFEDLRELRVLFVGAGEMIELVATHFAARRPRSIVVANRSAERGAALASRFAAQTMPLADLPTRLAEFDVVVSCTASTLPIIGLGAVERALKKRRNRPMLVVDLAVPRDVEAEVARLPSVYLYTLDDLGERVRGAGAARQAAVHHAQAIVETGVRGFVQWLEQRRAVPLIQALNAQAEAWRQAELARARRRLARGEPVDAVLDALASGLAHKLLHGARVELRTPQGDHALPEAVQRLFLRSVAAPAVAARRAG